MLSVVSCQEDAHIIHLKSVFVNITGQILYELLQKRISKQSN